MEEVAAALCELLPQDAVRHGGEVAREDVCGAVQDCGALYDLAELSDALADISAFAVRASAVRAAAMLELLGVVWLLRLKMCGPSCPVSDHQQVQDVVAWAKQ